MNKSHGALRKSAKNCAVGGPIKGKGTGTSDQVPIMASNGEFMIKAKAVKAIGLEVLEALNAIADKPDEKDSKAEAMREYGDGSESPAHEKAEGKLEGMKCGGAVRKMAGGGLIDEEQRKALIAQIPTGGTGTGPTPQPDPTQSASGTELGRNLNNAINAIPAGTMARGLVSGGAKIADSLVTSEKVGSLAAGAMKAMPYAIPAASAGALGIAASQPNPPPALPGSPAAVAATGSGALPKPYSPAQDSQAASPTDQTAVPGGAIPTAPAKPAFDPLAAKAVQDAQTQKDIALGNQMEATRKASEAEGYAAQDRGIDTSIAIAAKVDAERARQRAENTLSSTTDNAATRAQKEAAKQTLSALDGQQAQKAGNDAAMQRTTLADQTARRGQDITAKGQEVQAGALRQSTQFNQQLARDKFGIEQSQEARSAAKAGVEAKQQERLQAAFDAYDKDPSEKSAERVRVLMGKDKAPPQEKFTVVPEFDGNGQRIGTTVLDAQGRVVNTKNQANAAPHPEGTKLTGKDGKNYIVKNGVPVLI